MKKVLSVFTIFAVALSAAIIFTASNADAVPAFARQMQMSCKSCHFQHFPKLNAFGRAFKANGYTDVAVDTIDGDWHTSIPINLNASYITKARYQKNVSPSACNPCTGANRGSSDLVDEGTLFIGGRVSEHVGAALELGAGNGAQHWGNGTIIFGHDLESMNAHLGLAIWAADAAGPFWGKEIFNTGLIRGARGWENRDTTQAAGMIYRESDWQGYTAYVFHEYIFAAIGAATQGFGPIDVGMDWAGTYRVAITPPAVIGFETMVGVYGLFGGTSWTGPDQNGGTGMSAARYTQGNGRQEVNTNIVGIDFQAEGNLTEGITLGLYGNFLVDSGNPNDGKQLFTNGGRGFDYKRYQVGFDLGVLNDRLIGKFNYLHSSGRSIAYLGAYNAANPLHARAKVDIVSVGVYYDIRENVSLRPELSMTVGGKNPTGVANGQTTVNRASDTNFTLMLWYAF